MTYTKTTWLEEVTPTSAANLNHMEQGIADAHAVIGAGLFGDASDGSATINAGQASNAWLNNTGGVLRFDRDAYFQDLTINTPVNVAGCRIFVAGTLTFGPGGMLTANGLDAPAVAGAASVNNPTPFGGNQTIPTGVAGNRGTNGVASNGTVSALSHGIGGQGGAGGAGAAPGFVGGTNTNLWHNPTLAAIGLVQNQFLSAVTGGGQGSAGTGDTTTNTIGGNGGNAAGFIIVYARKVVDNSGGGKLFSARGGNGSNAGAGTGNAGGGGGGGGGVVLLYTLTPLSGVTVWTTAGGGAATADVSGGLGGAKANAGGNGTNGSAGTFLQVQIQ